MRHEFGFMHIPKTAGSALRAALDVADQVPVSPKSLDTTLFGHFNRFADLVVDIRETICVQPTEISASSRVIGHLSRQTLLTRFSPEHLMTVLREPRTRLLSLYTFWRSWDESQHHSWSPYGASKVAVTESVSGFLRTPWIAAQTDNVMTRMLLTPHPLIPPDGFIDPIHWATLASEAINALRSFGFVGLVEEERAGWERMGYWLDHPLDVRHVNVTASSTGPATDWNNAWTAETISVLASRTAIDEVLWNHVGSIQLGASYRAVADSSFVAKATRLAARPIQT